MPVPNKRQKTTHPNTQSESLTQHEDASEAAIGQPQAVSVSSDVSGQSTGLIDQSALRSQQRCDMSSRDHEEVLGGVRNGLTGIHKPHLLWEVSSIFYRALRIFKFYGLFWTKGPNKNQKCTLTLT